MLAPDLNYFGKLQRARLLKQSRSLKVSLLQAGGRAARNTNIAY